MRRIRVLTLTGILIAGSAAGAGAQIITSYDNSGARASAKVGYGGHGLDWDASVDSPLMADFLRVRGSLGRGKWRSEFDSYDDPIVTRLAASAIVFIRSPRDLKPYVGVGVAAYVPRGIDWNTRRGGRLILGMEGSGERWTIGLEVELDLPNESPNARRGIDDDLYMAGRIGLALRRRF